jgi:hypothetical protein
MKLEPLRTGVPIIFTLTNIQYKAMAQYTVYDNVLVKAVL